MEDATYRPDKKWLRDRLAEVGSNQSKLAEILGKHRSAVSTLLDGKRRLRVDEIGAIARHINRPVFEVAEWAGVPRAVSDNNGLAEMSQTEFSPQQPQPPKPATKTGQHPLWGIWKGRVTVLPDVDYTQPADPDWGKVYDD